MAGVTDLGSLDAEALSAEAVQQQQAVADHIDSTTGDPVDCIGNEAGCYMDVALAQALSALPPGLSVVSSPVCSTTSSDPVDGGQTNADASSTAFNHPPEAVITAPAVYAGRPAPDEQHSQVVPSPFAGAASAELLEAPTSAVATDAAPAESRNPVSNPDANVVSTADSAYLPAVDTVPAASESESAAGVANVPAGANSGPGPAVSPSSSSPNSNSNSLSTLQITPLARAGSSNLTGQVKSPSRLRRMSVPEPQLQLALEQQADPLNPGLLAPGPLSSGEPAVLQLQLQEHVAQHQQELWQQDVQLLDLEPTGMPADSMQDTAAVQPAAALGRNSSNMVFDFETEDVTSNSELSSNTAHGVTSSNPATPHQGHPQLPQVQQLLSAGWTESSTSSSSYPGALAATQQLPWPLTWHWPDKMLHAAATGARPINIHLTQPLNRSSSGGYDRPGSPRGTSSSTYSSRGSRPVSPRRGVPAGTSSSSRLGSPTRCRSPARSAPGDHQQQQYKPPELLSAIHTHLVAAPAVKAAFEAATAAALQGDTSTHSSSTISLNPDATTPEGSPVSAWHASLQQQFAAAFATWDKDGDGRLDADELRNMLEDVLPAGTVTKQEVRYCQVLLDRSGSGMLTPEDLLAAAHTAVALGVGIVPKPLVDINDVLLQLVVMLGAGQGLTSQVRSLFHDCDTSGTGKLGQTELGRLLRKLLPAISHQETRFILAHMCELDPESSGQVSLKQLVAAVQPVHQALQQSTGNSSIVRQQLLPAAEGPLVTQQQQQQQQSQYDLPKPPSPVRLSPRPDHYGSSSSSSSTQDAGRVVCTGGGGDTYDGGSSSSSAGEAALGVVADNDKPVPPVLWPMQELAALLSSNPAILQLAFMQTAAAAAAAHAKSPKHTSQSRSSRNSSVGGGSCSTSVALQQQLPHQQQQRYSLIPITLLPQLLAAAVPGWGGADISYAALQIRCHMNVIANFTVDTPTAAAAANPGGEAAAAAADPPTDLMYAELAATIISAAGTESAAAAGQLPPAVEQLVVDLTDDLMSNDSSRAKLAAAWTAAAAAVSNGANNSSSSSSSSVNHAASKSPVVAAVKLLCKQLIASHGLSDIRLLGWLTCLVRQQHLAMQLAAVQDHGGSSSSPAAADQVLSAEIDLDQFCEVLLQVVQGLLPAEDAALVEALRHQQQQQQQQQQHGGDHHWDAAALGDPAALGDEHPGSENSNRRARIMFDGSTPTPSDCSPAWHPAEHHQQKWDEGLRSLQSLDRVLEDKAGYFQPSHVKIPAYRGSNRGGSTPGSRTGGSQLYTSFLLEGNIGLQTRASERFSSNGGGVLLPNEVQQQREQLDRLRAAQQQAWKAEMLMQHMPWEGAYSPVAALAAAGAHGGGYFGQAKVVDILRISSSGFRTSSNASEGY